MSKVTTSLKSKGGNAKSKFTSEQRKLRAEASRLVSMANKRLKRMEQQNLINTPAYKKWVEDGGQKFGIKGKTMAEVKQEVARLNDFLKKQTSTVTGAKEYLKNVASKVGVTDFSDFNDLQNKLNNFFETTAKVKEYLRNSKEIGVSIGYQKIWEEVSNYVQEIGSELNLTEQDVLEVARKLVETASYGELDKRLDSWLDNF